MATRLRRSFDQEYPAGLYAHRSRAWSTIGVIPSGSSLHDDLERFLSGVVLGYYTLETGRLVFIGSSSPSPLSHVVLAHELTHALDDQHFRLERLDSLVTRCADEQEQAALGAIEGSAQFFSSLVAERFLTPTEQLQLQTESESAPTPDVPPFVRNMELWPYGAGERFIATLDSSGGTAAVNRALRRFPVSTEQVMHPEKYPSDAPVPVNIPDLAGALGAGWKDLDVSDVGEAFVDMLLALRLDRARADEAASGWDGGVYRAWSNGNHVAVVMKTMWESPEDAQQFADAMASWIDAGNQDAEVQQVRPTVGNQTQVLFASDAQTLRAVAAAVQKT